MPARKPRTWVLRDADGDEIRVTKTCRTMTWTCNRCGVFAAGVRCEHILSVVAQMFEIVDTFESEE